MLYSMKTKPVDDRQVYTSSPNNASAAPKKMRRGVVESTLVA
jgi:hypothetical protein